MFDSLKKRLKTLSFAESNVIIYYASKFYGQAPFSIVSKRTPKRPFFENTIFDAIYAIGFLLMLSFVTYTSLVGSFSNNATQGFPVTSTVGHYMHLFAGLLIAIISYLFAFNRIRPINRFVRNILAIDDGLHAISETHKLDYGRAFKFQFVLLVVGLLLFVSIGVYDFLIFGALYQSIGFFVSMMYSVPFVVASIVQAQFISAVHLLYERFKMINKFLKYIADTNSLMYQKTAKTMTSTDNDSTSKKNPVSIISSVKLDQTHSRKSVLIQPNPDAGLIGAGKWAKPTVQHDMDSDDDDSSHSLWDYIKTFFGQTNYPEPKQDIPPNLHLRMNELFSLHERLFDVGEQINNAYGIEIVSFITATFLITLFGFFFEIKVLFWKGGSSSVLQMIALSYVLWSLLACLIVYTVLTICKTTREEAHESALTIHVVLQNKPLFMLNDEIYYNKMKSFTLQILHRKNIFNFHGLGLFCLDYTFIFSAVSAATSYLIVLLQFDLAPDFDNSIFGKGANLTANFTGNVTI